MTLKVAPMCSKVHTIGNSDHDQNRGIRDKSRDLGTLIIEIVSRVFVLICRQ